MLPIHCRVRRFSMGPRKLVRVHALHADQLLQESVSIIFIKDEYNSYKCYKTLTKIVTLLLFFCKRKDGLLPIENEQRWCSLIFILLANLDRRPYER